MTALGRFWDRIHPSHPQYSQAELAVIEHPLRGDQDDGATERADAALGPLDAGAPTHQAHQCAFNNLRSGAH